MATQIKDEPLTLRRRAKLADPDDEESAKIHSHWELGMDHWPQRHWFEDSLLLKLGDSVVLTDDTITLCFVNATGEYRVDTEAEPVNQNGRWGVLDQEASSVG